MYNTQFEVELTRQAKKHNCNTVICGHIHHAEIKDMNGFLYINTGDFVESCTAIVEHFNGTLELVTWQQKDLPIVPNENQDVDITTT